MSKEQPTYYAIIPAEVRYDEKLSPNAKLLYAEITTLTQSTGVCWAGDNYFMELYNVHRGTIQRWLKTLEDNNYISREVIYKNGTKEIEKRFIRVYAKKIQGYTQKSDKGIRNNATENTTSINTTSTNIKDIVSLDFKSVIDYLNEKTGKSYKVVEGNKKYIRARYNDGYNLEDFKKVIDIKVGEWLDDKDYSKYLQPSTLFGNNFDKYLNQTDDKKKVTKSRVILEYS